LDAEKKNWVETPISVEELCSRVLGKSSMEVSEKISFNYGQGFPPIFFKPKEGFDSEKKIEISGKIDFRQFSANSEAEASKLLKCPRCNCFFATESDLKAHLKGVHHVEG